MFTTTRLLSSGLSLRELGRNIIKGQGQSRILCQVEVFNRSVSTSPSPNGHQDKRHDQGNFNRGRDFASSRYSDGIKLCVALGLTGSRYFVFYLKLNAKFRYRYANMQICLLLVTYFRLSRFDPTAKETFNICIFF